MFFSPVIYYDVLSGTAYKGFDVEAMNQYKLFGIISYLFIIFILIVFNGKICKKRDLKIVYTYSVFYKLYVCIIIILVFIYLSIYFNKLMLFRILNGLGDYDIRPDSYHIVPFWFSFSSLIDICLPSFLFAYIKSIKKDRYIMFFVLIQACALVLGGNKGNLIYFVIFFLLFFVFESSIFIKIFFAILSIFSFVFYIFIKGQNLYIFFNDEKALASPFRRFFVTQGAGLINKLYMLKEGMFVHVNHLSSLEIKRNLFSYIYGKTDGAHPTYFVGDIILKYGFIIGYLMNFYILYFIFYISEIIYYKFSNNLFLSWNFCFFCFLIGNSSFEKPNFYRFLIILFNVFLFFLLNKKRYISCECMASCNCNHLKLRA
jgi:hypothetical protein